MVSRANAGSSPGIAASIQVFFYDNAETYATRLMSCLRQLMASGAVAPDERCLVCQDNDLLYHYDGGPFNTLLEIMAANGIDRVAFDPTVYVNPGQLWNQRDPLPFPAAEGCVLYRNPCFYSYNVGPGIWKLAAWADVLQRFPDKTYRNIETKEVIDYTCRNHKVYNMHARPPKVAYYNRFALPFFIFIHITSAGFFIHDLGSPYLAEMQELYRLYGLTRPTREYRGTTW